MDDGHAGHAVCTDTMLGQTMAELATQGRDPNGSREIQFGYRDSNFPGINIPSICLQLFQPQTISWPSVESAHVLPHNYY